MRDVKRASLVSLQISSGPRRVRTLPRVDVSLCGNHGAVSGFDDLEFLRNLAATDRQTFEETMMSVDVGMKKGHALRFLHELVMK